MISGDEDGLDEETKKLTQKKLNELSNAGVIEQVPFQKALCGRRVYGENG